MTFDVLYLVVGLQLAPFCMAMKRLGTSAAMDGDSFHGREPSQKEGQVEQRKGNTKSVCPGIEVHMVVWVLTGAHG